MRLENVYAYQVTLTFDLEGKVDLGVIHVNMSMGSLNFVTL